MPLAVLEKSVRRSPQAGNEYRSHWHTARVTKISVGHSVLFGARPSSKTLAGHFCSDWVSTLLPLWKPLPRQNVIAAAWQSGAPFAAATQRSRPVTTRVFGNPVTVPVASLAASRARSPTLSKLSRAPCMSDLSLSAPSPSQRPTASMNPGRKLGLDDCAAGGSATGALGAGLGVGLGARLGVGIAAGP